MDELLMLASSDVREGFRAERCDHCSKQLWLHPSGCADLDGAEASGSRATLLCVRCAVAKYGRARLKELFGSEISI
jgi:hypothetical protein